MSMATGRVSCHYFPVGKYQIGIDMVVRDMAALGTALRAARRALGLSQPDLALAAGVGLRFIVDLEAGKPTLQAGKMLRVLQSLGGEFVLTGLPVDARGEEGCHGA